jgi:DNA replication protein DnaC
MPVGVNRISILLTGNRDLSEWPDLFADPLLASADLDRLTHNAHVLIITGRSFRAHGQTFSSQEASIES